MSDSELILIIGLLTLLVGAAARFAWRGFVAWYDRQWFDSEGDGRYD